MMLTIIELTCLSYLFVVAEPLTLFKRLIGFKEENYFEYGKVKKFFHRLLNCCMCSGFWIGLIATGNIGTAAIISITSEILYRIMNKI